MAQTVGKANYAASSARAKSRKSSLIDKVRMKQLLQQDVNTLSPALQIQDTDRTWMCMPRASTEPN